MDTVVTKTSPDLSFAQIAWVVKDIEAAKRFFHNMIGIDFSPAQTIRAREFDATYYGKPSDAESLVAMAFCSGTFVELIQPTSGKSIFQDYLDENPSGGIQHVAYSTSVAKFDKIVSHFADEGFKVISTFDHPIAKIAFFDTRKEIGVITEIMGITREGEEQVEKMKE